MRLRERSLATALLAAGALACSGAGTRGAPSFEQYTGALLTTAGVPPGGATCAMFGNTRVGRCTLTRTAAEVRGLVDGKRLPLVPDANATFYGDTSCATLPAFGAPNGSMRFDLLPGARRFVPIPNATLPPNTNNVKLDAIVVAPNGTDVCVELRFPYG